MTAPFIDRKPRNAEEDALQMNVVSHLRLYGVRGLVFYMIRNHGMGTPAMRRKNAKMGLRPGASDLGLIIPPNGQAAMLELKHGRNKPSADQETFGADTEAAGGLYAVAWDIDQAVNILTAWGALKPNRARA